MPKFIKPPSFFLILVAAILCLTMLGSHELWTQEGRWGAIDWQMMISHDYFHPSLNGYPYYDKPVLTYWLQILTSHIAGAFNEFTLRLPSALCAILAVWAIYRLGKSLNGKRMGLLAGWMLTSTYAFIFWGRTASSDIYNIAGILLALFFYFHYKNRPSFASYFYFFLTLAITSLCKGIVCAAIVIIALLPNLLDQHAWRRHLNLSFFAAAIIAVIIYFMPFIVSNLSHPASYEQSGLNEVFRENILRYFNAWDHKDPVYTYFIYLPIYLFPWTLFFIPSIFYFFRQWKGLSTNARWTAWAFLLSFIFLTCSESRRNYYTLMLVPFAILMTAEWLSSLLESSSWIVWMKRTTILSVGILFISFAIIQPTLERKGYLTNFSHSVHSAAEQQSPWNTWHIALFDASVKMPFYLRSNFPVIPIDQAENLNQTLSKLTNEYSHVLLLTRAKKADAINPSLKDYEEIVASHEEKDKNFDVVFILSRKPA